MIYNNTKNHDKRESKKKKIKSGGPYKFRKS